MKGNTRLVDAGDLSTSSDDVVIAEIRIDGNNVLGILDPNSGNTVGIAISGGSLYRVDLVLDWGQQTIELWVNSNRYASNIAFGGAGKYLSQITMYNIDAGTVAYWDDFVFCNPAGGSKYSSVPTQVVSPPHLLPT
jgi:hypothetical protein